MSKHFAVISPSPRFDIEQFITMKNYKGAFLRNRGKVKCPDCKGFLCVCQSILKDYGFRVVQPMKELTMEQKVWNCPQNCSNSTVECVGCFMKDKFVMRVVL